jgi:hypothetical protein
MSESESETADGVTAHFRDDGGLELRSEESPDAWIIADHPVSVEQ